MEREWSREMFRMSCERAISRREFLRSAAATGTATAMFFASPLRAAALPPTPKTIVVTFGGGARDEETFAPEGQRYIPRLLEELIPQATFYTQVINRGILGHYVANAGLATGCYETFDNFMPIAPSNPTIFEYYRRDRQRTASDVWAIAPSNGFDHIGESSHTLYGHGLGATVVLPKQLLTLANHHAVADYDQLLRDNYESPIASPLTAKRQDSLHGMAELMKLSMDDFLAHARRSQSPDELSLYIAQHVMQTVAPSLLWITLHDIDIAHSGAFSLYTEAISRTDSICADLWKSVQSNPEYGGKTNLFILPDFGRDSDMSPGGNGFQHHRTGDALSRTTWLMAMGPNIRQNVAVDRPVQCVDLVPTLAHLLGCNARFSRGSLLTEVL